MRGKKATTSAKRARRAKRAPRRRRATAPPARAIEATLAELAHEIRTPLTGILALGELLTTSDLGERERGWASAIKSTAEHLAMLTSLIVDAARADAEGLVLRRELIRPRRLAEAVAASLKARADAKGLTAEVTIAADLPEAVIGDPLRLRGALENLIDNAIKFTERGGVRFDVVDETAARGRVRLRFTVSDSGIGLAADEIKRLFRPFAQASDETALRFGGAGLGLAFVKRIAKAMGGDLTVTSKPGAGASFQLTATFDRVVEAADAAERDGPSARAAAPLHPLNILCAEDNPYGRVVLNTILTELGHRADFVGTGAAAVEAAARGGYDVVLMDVTLPGLDGLEATRRIRALDRPAGGVALIGISGRANAADEAAGRAAGMDGYLVKPISPAALTQLLVSLSARA
ncbi:MAG TPA: ATP-binding protein [Xanthobacteraceae bacterium]|nr:ATP-binding protein [Xanthobacteraceae bacterium]